MPNRADVRARRKGGEGLPPAKPGANPNFLTTGKFKTPMSGQGDQFAKPVVDPRTGLTSMGEIPKSQTRDVVDPIEITVKHGSFKTTDGKFMTLDPNEKITVYPADGQADLPPPGEQSDTPPPEGGEAGLPEGE